MSDFTKRVAEYLKTFATTPFDDETRLKEGLKVGSELLTHAANGTPDERLFINPIVGLHQKLNADLRRLLVSRPLETEMKLLRLRIEELRNIVRTSPIGSQERRESERYLRSTEVKLRRLTETTKTQTPAGANPAPATPVAGTMSTKPEARPITPSKPIGASRPALQPAPPAAAANTFFP